MLPTAAIRRVACAPALQPVVQVLLLTGESIWGMFMPNQRFQHPLVVGHILGAC